MSNTPLSLLDAVFGINKRIMTVGGQMTEDSYADLANIARVDPLCIISADLLNADYLMDLLQSSLNLVTSYYLRALPFAASNKNVDVKGVLKKLKPSSGYDVVGTYKAFESLKLDLEGLEDSFESDGDMEEIYQFGLPDLSTEKKGGKKKKKKNKKIKYKGDVNEENALHVGKVIEIELPFDKVTVPLTVTIQLTTIPTSVGICEAIMSDETVDDSLTERWYKFQAGRISGGKFLTGSDIAMKRKKLLLEDTSGILEEVRARRKRGLFIALTQGKRSYGNSTNMVIVSKDIIRRVERNHRSSIDNVSTRALIFDYIGVMVLMVIDQEHEMATIYYRGIAMSTTIPIRALKRAAKNNGPDMNEILKALTLGQAPAF